MDDDKICPNCGQPNMEMLGNTTTFMCPACKTIAWDEHGKTEWRVPEKLTPEEVAALERDEDDEPVRPAHRRRRVM